MTTIALVDDDRNILTSVSIAFNILGQVAPKFDLAHAMDHRGIFIANLAKGQIGGNHPIFSVHYYCRTCNSSPWRVANCHPRIGHRSTKPLRPAKPPKFVTWIYKAIPPPIRARTVLRVGKSYTL